MNGCGHVERRWSIHHSLGVVSYAWRCAWCGEEETTVSYLTALDWGLPAPLRLTRVHELPHQHDVDACDGCRGVWKSGGAGDELT